jgi:hypothetical protein
MARGSIVIVELGYELECREFETRWGDRMFSIYLIITALGPGDYSVSNRNENHKQKNVSREYSAAGA